MHATIAPQTKKRPQLKPHRGNILVIDDDEAMVDVLTRRLEQQGYRTRAAHSAVEGLEAARQERPLLIVLDLRLPDADGLEVCQRLADDSETCLIPVIILSGMESPDIIRRTRSAGCHYFLRKPYDPNTLLCLIEHAARSTSEWDVP